MKITLLPDYKARKETRKKRKQKRLETRTFRKQKRLAKRRNKYLKKQTFRILYLKNWVVVMIITSIATFGVTYLHASNIIEEQSANYEDEIEGLKNKIVLEFNNITKFDEFNDEGFLVSNYADNNYSEYNTSIIDDQGVVVDNYSNNYLTYNKINNTQENILGSRVLFDMLNRSLMNQIESFDDSYEEYYNINFSGALYRLESDKCLCKTDERMIYKNFVRTENEYKEKYYRIANLPTDDFLDEWWEPINEYDEEVLDIEDIYISEDEFYLGKLVTGKFDSEMNFTKTGDYYDFTPKDISGLEHINPINTYTKKDNTTIMSIIMFGGHSNSFVEQNIDDFYNKIKDELNYWNFSESYDIDKKFYKINISSFNKISFAPDINYSLITGMYYNYFDVFKKQIVIKYIIIFIISNLLVFIISKYRYQPIKVRNEMEDYRKNMTNAMAHDLKSPLMAMSGMAENLINNIHIEKREYYASLIIDNIFNMNQMIDQILILSNIEDGNIKIKLIELNMEKLISELIIKFEPICEKKGLILDLSGSVKVKADKELMTRCIDNLISNAVRYSKEGSIIKIDLLERELRVSNKFDGEIEESKIMDLTKPFVKGTKSRGDIRSSGIGLAIVKQIVNMHKFYIDISLKEDNFIVTIKW